MVPNVNTRGQSFKGVTAYLVHDKERAKTTERVEWSETHNLLTDDIEKAALVMAWTDKNADFLKQDAGGSAAGRKASAGNVYHFSISWRPDEEPTRENMAAAGHASVERLGLKDHQYYFVAHNDEPHQHLHIVVNLVNPETGYIHKPSRDFKILDRWAYEYEKENGIVCENRDKKYKTWEQGNNAFSIKLNREELQKKVTNAFEHSDSGQAFKNALDSEGLQLARGSRRGFVLIDNQGEIYALNRQINFDDDIKRKEKNAAINAKLEGIKPADLQDAEELSNQIKETIRESQKLEQEEETTSQKFNQQAAGENGGHTATDSTARGNRGLTAAEQKETAHSFNQKAREGEGQSPEEAAKTQPYAENPYSGKTTEELAADFVELAGEPMQNLRGWLDATEQGQPNNSLLARSSGSSPADNELRQVRGEEEPATGSERNDIEQPDYFDRDKYEAEQQELIDAAGITHFEEQVLIVEEYNNQENSRLKENKSKRTNRSKGKRDNFDYNAEQKRRMREAFEELSKDLTLKRDLTPQLEKLYIPRFVRLKEIKGENGELGNLHNQEYLDLKKRLDKETSTAEQTHRAKWEKVINEERTAQNNLMNKMREKGIKAAFVRIFNKQKIIDEYQGREKNIENAIMRQNEGLGDLELAHKERFGALRIYHRQQREELRAQQSKDLQALEDTRADKEEKLLQAAKASPELAAEIRNAASPKNSRAKKQAVEIEQVAQEHKTKIKSAAHEPADGAREHEAEQQKPLIERFDLRQKIAAQAAALRGDYGEDIQGLSQRNNISEEEQTQILERFAEDHPEELERADQIREQEQDNGLER